MIKVVVTLLYLLVLASSFKSYKEQNNILILHQNDFPDVFLEYPHLVILFYTPWNGQCKKLAPVYKQIALDLKQKRSTIKLAKVDATVQTKLAQTYRINEYPTLKFFIDGNPIPYNGEKHKQDILKWIDKKLVPAVVPISTQRELTRLSKKKTVSVVYYGDDPQEIEMFKALALADDSKSTQPRQDSYYNYTGSVIADTANSRVEIYRSFDQIAHLQGPFKDNALADFIEANSIPYLKQFDTNTIRQIFVKEVPVLVLFNVDKDVQLHDILNSFAKNYNGEKNLIVTEIDVIHISCLIFCQSDNQYYEKFADYLALELYECKLLIIEASSKSKFLYPKKISYTFDYQNLADFVKDYQQRRARRVGMTDSIDSEEL